MSNTNGLLNGNIGLHPRLIIGITKTTQIDLTDVSEIHKCECPIYGRHT